MKRLKYCSISINCPCVLSVVKMVVDLRYPLESTQGNGHNIYSNFLEAVEAFQKIIVLPVSLPTEK